MRRLFLLAVLAFIGYYTHAQNYNLGNTGGYAGWFRLGTLTLQQQGADAYIDIYAGSGYNANYGQNGESHIHFRTSNGESANGFLGAGSFYNTGRTKVIQNLKVIQIDPNTWTFYAYMSTYSGGYAVLNLKSAGASWQPTLTFMTPPENAISSDLVEELVTTSNSYFLENVGIGTSTPKEKLSVDGNIGAREIQVRSTGWPEYVFKPEYALPSLADIEKQIKQNGHLPEMPSAAEVETNGIALGEMNKLLLKKVEELTLHLIQQGKEIEQLKKQISKR